MTDDTTDGSTELKSMTSQPRFIWFKHNNHGARVALNQAAVVAVYDTGGDLTEVRLVGGHKATVFERAEEVVRRLEAG